MEQMARTPQQIGAAVRRVRRQQNLTQEQLGAKVTLRQATVSKLEAGEPRTQLCTLLDVLGALNLELVIRPRTSTAPSDFETIF